MKGTRTKQRRKEKQPKTRNQTNQTKTLILPCFTIPSLFNLVRFTTRQHGIGNRTPKVHLYSVNYTDSNIGMTKTSLV